MRKTILISIALLLQIAVPVWMIHDRETTLRTGTEIVFPVRPVDPADAFRGRYITLGFSTNLTQTVLPSGLKPGKLWVRYQIVGGKAVAISGLSKMPSSEGVWMKAQVRNLHYRQKREAKIDLPFQTFYLNESVAPATERLFRGRKWKTVEAVVRVRNGKAALAEVLADGKPIADAVRELSAKQKTP